jgi:hypothetical protein
MPGPIAVSSKDMKLMDLFTLAIFLGILQQAQLEKPSFHSKTKSIFNSECFLDKQCYCMHSLPLSVTELKLYQTKHAVKDQTSQPLSSHCEKIGQFHWLSSTEVKACLNRNPVVFIGDSRMQQLYHEIQDQLFLPEAFQK